MATRIPTAVRNAAVDAVVDRVDAAATAGHVEIRTGAQPANANSAASGVLLADVTLADPAFGAGGAVNPGQADADVVPDVETVGVADGDAGWFRVYDGDDNTVWDGSVTATGGGGDMELNTVTISTGVAFQIVSWAITMGAG